MLVLRRQSSSNNSMASIRLPGLASVLAARLGLVVVGKTGVATGVARRENRTQDYRVLGVHIESIGSHRLFEAAA